MLGWSGSCLWPGEGSQEERPWFACGGGGGRGWVESAQVGSRFKTISAQTPFKSLEAGSIENFPQPLVLHRGSRGQKDI